MEFMLPDLKCFKIDKFDDPYLVNNNQPQEVQ